MTSLHTLPIPHPPLTRTHEHAWLVESSHTTSEGRVLYVRCTDCGAWRVDLQEHPAEPPQAFSRPMTPEHPEGRPGAAARP